jgi:uncharacterized protein YyaL (SSP411 family)
MASSSDAPNYTNRLINSTNPYLLEHAHNPVDWYEWGEEALERARREDKPIHLSVGYSSCHWCHQMSLHNFEDERTAALMNEHFVNIKVDREERPDIDNIYMTAVQAMTGGGGWPMTVFLTPDGVPFYGGTYFPPEDRYGMPAFTRVLEAVADAYRSRPDEVRQSGEQLLEQIRKASGARLAPGALSPALLDDAYASLHGEYDPTYGGFGEAPKFPQAMALEFLLRYAARTGVPQAAEMLAHTLRGMAEGGIYDQLGGGFHRYSVDERWLVPHFEKMLYDNALLARVYTEAHQISGDPFFRRIAEETLDYIVREMRHPAGGFFSTQDADSLPAPDAPHKHEGAFFVWTPAELRAALGGDALLFGQIYDVTERGNFEGKNILRILRRPPEVARVTGTPPERLEAQIARARAILFEERAQRPRPNLDDKVLTAWNGMALRAFAYAADALGREDYRQIARQNAEFLLRELRRPDGALLRSWKDGRAGATQGFLEDYALLADGLLALYEATGEPRWLQEAQALADAILARFWDDQIAGFYDTAADHEALVVRPRDTGDNATPSGNSVAADVLLRLALIFDRQDYRERALAVLGGMTELMRRYPTGFGRFLCAAEFALAQPHEIVLVGRPGAPDTQALRAAVAQRFIPNKVLLQHDPDGPAPVASPLLEGRGQIGGRAAAYVCHNYACQLPATDPQTLREQLGV